MIGWENIELISDRPLEVMLEDMARLKQEYPDRRALELKITGFSYMTHESVLTSGSAAGKHTSLILVSRTCRQCLSQAM